MPPQRERRIALVGAVNFRDLGGYPAADGRRIRWGRLFRSDSLAELGEADLIKVEALGLRSVCDMRHDEERQLKPNRLDPDWAIQTHAIGFYPSGAKDLMDRVKTRAATLEEARQIFVDMYRRLPIDNAGHYERLLDILTRQDALPALIHCTSGKDRTGFAVATVMLALGVPREVIAEDYALTNQYRRDLSFMIGDDVDPQVLELVKRADPEFLRGAFDVIDEVWSGDERFIREGLKLSAEKQRYLQDQLLEA